jgi:hypothetical protein
MKHLSIPTSTIRNILFAIYGGYLQNAVENLENHFQGMKEAGPKFRKSMALLGRYAESSELCKNPDYVRGKS